MTFQRVLAVLVIITGLFFLIGTNGVWWSLVLLLVGVLIFFTGGSRRQGRGRGGRDSDGDWDSDSDGASDSGSDGGGDGGGGD